MMSGGGRLAGIGGVYKYLPADSISYGFLTWQYRAFTLARAYYICRPAARPRLPLPQLRADSMANTRGWLFVLKEFGTRWVYTRENKGVG